MNLSLNASPITMKMMNLWKILSLSALCAFILSVSPIAISAPASNEIVTQASVAATTTGALILAEAKTREVDNEKPLSGTLVLPAAPGKEKSEKKCMTVCQRWGQECMIDPTRGVRKCRRTCKEFGQECF